MNRKMYWGVAILILLLGTSSVFIIQHELTEHREKTVLVENHLEGFSPEIDMFDSITLPTNEELVNYTDADIEELYRVTHEAFLKASGISDEFTKRGLAIIEASQSIPQDDKLFAKKTLQLLNQSSKLTLMRNDWRERWKQWRKEEERINQHTQHYGRGSNDEIK